MKQTGVLPIEEGNLLSPTVGACCPLVEEFEMDRNPQVGCVVMKQL